MRFPLNKEDTTSRFWILDSRFSILLFALFFGLFLYTAYPTVSPYRDSGDLSAAAVTLGVAHPPGYPFYSILGRAWLSLLKLGDPAYRMNVLSAFAGALAVTALASALASEGLVAAVAASCLLGLSPAFWKLSLVSEMYSLNALFGAVLFLLIARTPMTTKKWLLTALILGLGLVNHQTLILLAPGLLFLPLLEKERAGGRIALMLFFVFLGLSIYLFLPLRSFQDPTLNWGEPKTLRTFFRVLTRADYGGLRLHPERSFHVDWPTFLNAARVSWLAFSAELGAAALFVCAIGAWFRRRETLARFCLAGFVLSGPFFIFLSNLPPTAHDTLPILEPHLLLPVLCLAPLFAYGLSAFSAQQSALRHATIVLAFLPVAHAAGLTSVSHRADFAAHDYGKNVFAAIPGDSLLVDPDDPTAFTLSYWQVSRDFRTDLVPLAYFRTRWGYEQLHRRHPDVVPSSSIRSGHELYYYVLNYNLRKGRDVFADLPHKALAPYKTFPQGWAYRIYDPGDSHSPSPLALEDWYRRSLSLWELSRARPAVTTDFFSVHALDYGASALNNLGVQALGDRRFDTAESAFKRALTKQPKLDQAWNNWGNVLYQKKDYARSAAAYRVALEIKGSANYRYNLGRTLMAAGKVEEAEKTMLAALETADIPDAANDLGLLWLNRGEAKRAAEAFEKILVKRRDYRPAVFNLGIARAQLGDKTGATAAFKWYRDTAKDPADKADADSWLKQLK